MTTQFFKTLLGRRFQGDRRNRSTAPVESENSSRCRTVERGFTTLELVVTLWFIGILTVLALGVLNGRIEKARLAKCMCDLRSIQSTAWTHSDGLNFPPPGQLWEIAWAGKKPGPYFYLPDNEDPNAGHGNDIDEFDEQNPGKAPREDKDLKFIVLCQHDHRTLANYVFIEDEGPPTIAGWNALTDPHYDRFLHGNYYKDGEGGKGVPGGGRDNK